MRRHCLNKDTEVGTEVICIGNNFGTKFEREISMKLELGKIYHLHWFVNQPLPYIAHIDVIFVQEFIGVAFPAHCFSLIGETTLEDVANKIQRRDEEAIRRSNQAIQSDSELIELSKNLILSFNKNTSLSVPSTEIILELMEKRKNSILDTFGITTTRGGEIK